MGISRIILSLIISFCMTGHICAQTGQPVSQSTDRANEEIVVYPASFYSRFAPNTAFDMIRQTPGFILDDGGDQRGLGASAGNILINDRRPSAKQDLPSVILARIPAGLVEKVEVIRGQVRDIDLQGQSVVANIVLKEDTEAAIRWDVKWRYNIDFKSTYEGGISISDNWNGIDYNAGWRCDISPVVTTPSRTGLMEMMCWKKNASMIIFWTASGGRQPEPVNTGWRKLGEIQYYV